MGFNDIANIGVGDAVYQAAARVNAAEVPLTTFWSEASRGCTSGLYFSSSWAHWGATWTLSILNVGLDGWSNTCIGIFKYKSVVRLHLSSWTGENHPVQWTIRVSRHCLIMGAWDYRPVCILGQTVFLPEWLVGEGQKRSVWQGHLELFPPRR